MHARGLAQRAKPSKAKRFSRLIIAYTYFSLHISVIQINDSSLERYASYLTVVCLLVDVVISIAADLSWSPEELM